MPKNSKSAGADLGPESAKDCPAGEWSFETALKRLEELVCRLEQGNTPLEQSLAEYAEAVELMRVCQGKLDDAQCRIEVLSGVDSDGQPVVRPLATQGNMSLEAKRQSRSSRRSAQIPPQSPPSSVGSPQPSAADDESGQLF